MLFFLDTADVKEIRALADTGLVDGVTTNPSLVAQGHTSFPDLIKEICAIIPGPVSAEVISPTTKGMIEEGRILAKLASNVVIKVPLTHRRTQGMSGLNTRGNSRQCYPVFYAYPSIACGKIWGEFHLTFLWPA